VGQDLEFGASQRVPIREPCAPRGPKARPGRSAPAPGHRRSGATEARKQAKPSDQDWLMMRNLMVFNHRVDKNICVVSIEGNIALDGVNEAKEYLRPLLENREVKGLLINFSQVNFIDSSGIGLIVSLFKTLQQREAKFALSNLSKKNEEIFTITRLNKILDIYPSEAEAMSAMLK
jgi:anti-anti-sigma factor